jgi:hypothetical protein
VDRPSLEEPPALSPPTRSHRLRDTTLPTTSCPPMGEQHEHRAPVHVHPTRASELSTRTPPMARFSEPEDGLTTSATRTDARAQARGRESLVRDRGDVSPRSRSPIVIRLSCELVALARNETTSEVATSRPRALRRAASRSSRPNRVEVPFSSFERELESPGSRSDRAPPCRAHVES